MIRKILVVAALTLGATACGDQTRMGAAATFGDVPRISEAELSDAVTEWRDSYRANPLPAQQLTLADPESTPRSVLSRLIAMRVSEKAARDRGIVVTSAQVDGFIDKVAREGGRNLFDLFTISFGVPPSHSREFARMIVVEERLATGASSGAAANEQVHQALTQTAQKMDIKVNPRYGGGYADGLLRPVRTCLSLMENEEPCV
ncbi:SurA N-terminal domain-containing protein [Actinocorallia sp. B10E7]|uniref:SurA N-terminal domain-containing protein n=1 Tax=Actinocorallia sp. B10E7 TaxID=3153558 RepID=UPI00325E8EFB